jgi:hypothetical protein
MAGINVRTVAVIVALALPAVACSDSSGPEGALRNQDAMEIFAELMFAVSMATMGSELGFGEQAASAALSGSGPFSSTVACDGGGSITVSGSSSDNINNSGTGTLTGSYTQTPNNCVVGISRGNVVVSGDPNLTGSWSASYSNGNPVGNMTYSWQGAYRYNGAVSGRCSMNITSSINMSTYSGSVSGTMCGQTINQSY